MSSAAVRRTAGGSHILRELTTEELKRTELDILRAIRDFCDAKGLKYFLCGGTLLGAVRHKGFIPWDDDIDIGMLRSDYETFINEFPDTGRYRVITYKNNKEYRNPYAKVVDTATVLKEQLVRNTEGMGVFVDVFPFDGLGDTMEGALAILNKVHHNDHFGNYCQFFFYPPKSPKKIAKNIKMVYSRLTRKMYFDAIGRLCMKHSFEDSKFAGATMGQYREREILPKEAFDGVTSIEFEGDTFSAPVGWEAYLKSLYHDYMQLPPEEKRVTHHSFKAYWKE